MSGDAEVAALAPRRPDTPLFDPALMTGRMQTDFRQFLRWLGVSVEVPLHIHAYLPGETQPKRQEDDRNSLSDRPGDFEALSEDSRERLSPLERSERRVMSDKELNSARLSWEYPGGPSDTEQRLEGGGPVDLAKKGDDPRVRPSDTPIIGLYTRTTPGDSRAVHVNLGLFRHGSAVYAAIAHECTHLFLDLHGAQTLKRSGGAVRSNMDDLEEERRTDRVAVLLGFGTIMLNGAADYRRNVGRDLLYNGRTAIARDHREFCRAAGIPLSDATRGMTEAALEVFHDS